MKLEKWMRDESVALENENSIINWFPLLVLHIIDFQALICNGLNVALQLSIANNKELIMQMRLKRTTLERK